MVRKRLLLIIAISLLLSSLFYLMSESKIISDMIGFREYDKYMLFKETLVKLIMYLRYIVIYPLTVAVILNEKM